MDHAKLLREASDVIADMQARCYGTEDRYSWLCQQLRRAAGDAPVDKRPALSPQAIDWLANGDRGASAETIFTHLTKVDALRGTPATHPEDAIAFGKCRKLLEACPEIEQIFAGMRFVSPYWSGLYEHWDSLCRQMDTEAPNWRKHRGMAPATYTFIKNIIKDVANGRLP